MYLPAVSIYDGTWSGNEPAPAEIVDFELMFGMHWSWKQLEETPPYVRRYCTDFLIMRREAKARGRGSGG